MTPDCRCRYLCERCGGSGKQEEGNYSYATNSYTGKAGKCQICDGTGYLGYINQQQAARLANLPALPVSIECIISDIKNCEHKDWLSQLILAVYGESRCQ